MWAELGLLLIAIQGKGTSFEWFLDQENHSCYCSGINGCPEEICKDGCSHGWNGPLCQIPVNDSLWFLPPDDYPCHCANKGNDCPQDGCHSACEEGWYGFLCQIGNVAKNKRAYQSSSYFNNTASKAVDGLLPGPVLYNDHSDIAHCSHTTPGSTGNAWWYVDLGDLHEIVNVVVVGRPKAVQTEGGNSNGAPCVFPFIYRGVSYERCIDHNNPQPWCATTSNYDTNNNWGNCRVTFERLGNLSILVGNDNQTTSATNNWTLCVYKEVIQINQAEQYTCSSPLIGRQLKIQLNQAHPASPSMLTLCEVYVNGYVIKKMRSAFPGGIEISQSCSEIQINFTNPTITSTELSPIAYIVYIQDNPRMSPVSSRMADNPRSANFVLSHQVRATPNMTVAAIYCSSKACSMGPLFELKYKGYSESESEMALSIEDYSCHFTCTGKCAATTVLGECAPDWYGPLCQIGNVARVKKAQQSSNYTGETSTGAENAIDGLVPASDSKKDGWGVKHCSHTATNISGTRKAWWYVNLGWRHTIFAVKITKRLKDHRLANFSIRVSNSNNVSPPSPDWLVCASNLGMQNNLTYVYNCTSPIVGQRVGIILGETRENILILCEVYVYGYRIITMPTLDTQTVKTSADCNTLTVNISEWLPMMYIRSPTDYFIHLNDNTTGYAKEYRRQVDTGTNTSVTIKTNPGHVHLLSIAASICQNDSCSHGPQFIVGMVNSGFRQAVSAIVNNCTQVWVTATSKECRLPSNLNVNCSSPLTGKVIKGNGTFCNLEFNETFTCNVSFNIEERAETLPFTFTAPNYGDVFSSSADFPCFCKRGAPCRLFDGACPRGCNRKSSGPGCQIGELSRHNRNVQQSSVPDISSGPEMAIDGNTISCSKTAPYLSEVAWWGIALADAQLYYIYSISVTLEKGSSHERLYALISNSSIIGLTGQGHSASIAMAHIGEGTYTLRVNGGAKQVTLFANDSFHSGLSICDVSIRGYLQKDCGDSDYFGPGCLLLKPASPKCLESNGTVGNEFGECSRTRCPNDTHLPPQCWRIMPVPESTRIIATRTCDVISGSIRKDFNDNFIQPNTSIHVMLANQESRSGSSTSSNLNSNFSGPGWFSFNETEFTSDYVVSVAAKVCTDSRCVDGPRVNVTMPALQQDVHYDISNLCLNVGYVVENQRECFIPIVYEVVCSGHNKMDYKSVNKSLCHLDPGTNYDCNLTVFHQTSLLKFRLSIKLPEASLTSVTGAVAGAVGTVATLAAIVVLVLILRHRRTPRSKAKPASVDQPKDADCDQFVGVMAMTDLSDNVPNEDVYENVKQMTIKDFYEYVSSHNDSILLGFRELPGHEFHSCSVGKQTDNKSRNRYQNIIPYDVNRVILESTEKNPDGYINASYIKNMDGSLKFIAAQGPTRTTIEEFWEMIWQVNCSVIVMLTGYVEQGKRKCEAYFPVLPSENSGVTVKVSHVDDIFRFTLTTLVLSKGGTVKHVNHCHYHLWPDKSVPEYLPHFAMFREKVRMLQEKGHEPIGPTVVHCSAGAGRTGAFIAIQMAIDRYHDDKSLDILRSISKLREQRLSAVQTKEQCLFVHRAVLHDLMTEPFIIESGDVQVFLERRSSETWNLTEEWKTLQQLTSCFNVSDYTTALTEENAWKNREPNIVASDKWRPFMNDYKTGQSLYVNAVYCHGYYSKNAFLATQVPLAATVTDFWQMVYDSEASAMVLLEDITKEKPRFEYLPSTATEHGAEPFKVGHFNVTCTEASASCKNYVVNDAELSMTIGVSKAVKHVRIYRLHEWPCSSNYLAEIFIDMADELTKWRDLHQERPVIVQCRDGATRCGLFIAAINSLHQYAHDDQLFIHHMVEMARLSQPRFIKDEAQYSLIYDTIKQSRCSEIYANL